MTAERLVFSATGAGLSVSGATVATGSTSVAQVPFPTVLVSCSVPPSWTASPCTMDNPSPVPFPTCFVEKNGSIARFSISGDIPLPVSATDNLRYWPGANA